MTNEGLHEIIEKRGYEQAGLPDQAPAAQEERHERRGGAVAHAQQLQVQRQEYNGVPASGPAESVDSYSIEACGKAPHRIEGRDKTKGYKREGERGAYQGAEPTMPCEGGTQQACSDNFPQKPGPHGSISGCADGNTACRWVGCTARAQCACGALSMRACLHASRWAGGAPRLQHDDEEGGDGGHDAQLLRQRPEAGLGALLFAHGQRPAAAHKPH